MNIFILGAFLFYLIYKLDRRIDTTNKRIDSLEDNFGDCANRR